MSAGAPSSALARCVGDVDAFFEKYWEQRPYLRHGGETGFADLLLSLDDVDHIITRTSPRTPTFRLVRGGRALPRASYTRHGTVGGQRVDDLPDPGRIMALFDDGATIALQGLHRWWPPVAALCRGLQETLTHPVQANAYITPPGSRGLDVHHDTHDVLALQSEGRKHWVVHEPAVPLPLPRHRWDSDRHAPGERVIDTDLTPGDTLYLPRGTPHAAETTDTYSVHLTIGIRVVTWQQLLERAITRAGDDPRFRAALPPGFGTRPERLADELAAVLDDAGEWLAGMDTQDLVAETVEDLWTRRQPDLRHGLAQLVTAGTIDDETKVRARTGNRALLREQEGRLALVTGDRTVLFPLAARPALERLLDGTTRVGDLADVLDAGSRVVLVRRLLREGLLLVGGPGDG